MDQKQYKHNPNIELIFSLLLSILFFQIFQQLFLILFYNLYYFYLYIGLMITGFATGIIAGFVNEETIRGILSGLVGNFISLLSHPILQKHIFFAFDYFPLNLYILLCLLCGGIGGFVGNQFRIIRNKKREINNKKEVNNTTTKNLN